MSPLDLLTDIGATYRLTRLVVADTFPPAKALRGRIVEAHTERKEIQRQGVTVGTIDNPDALAELIQCPFCASVYIAFGVSIARLAFPRQWGFVAKALTLAAVAGHVSAWLDDT